MNNINKIDGGFIYNETHYKFLEIDGQYYNIISDEQSHIHTDIGTILLDLSCSIDDNFYNDINTFIYTLYLQYFT